MKKNIIIAALSAASALLLCASCQKQELAEQNNGINASGKVFTAIIEQGLTKTTITSEYKVNWETGDQIDIYGSIFSATPDASDATKATFTKVSGSDPTPDYTAVYPASIMVETQATLPATQTYAAGKFNAPMCAMSSTETLEFKNFCGVLCFALKGTDKVKSIAVTANEQLCGPFEFADATSFSFTGENEGYTVTLDCGEGVQLDASTATNFYVYLPPKDSYTAGMKIVVTSTEGKTFEKTTTTAVKIERNNLYTFDWHASFSGSAEPEYVELFSENFEDGSFVDTWTFIDADGDGYNWVSGAQLGLSSGFAHGGDDLLISQSYDNDYSRVLYPDNWAFTPAISLSATDNILSFWITAQDASYQNEHYAVYIAEEIPSGEDLASQCTMLMEQTFPDTPTFYTTTLAAAPQTKSQASWLNICISLPDSFRDKTVHIGFRHFDCSDEYILDLDDVKVEGGNP